MCQVLIQSTLETQPEARRVEQELVRRAVDARSVTYGVARANPTHWSNLEVVVAIVPAMSDSQRREALREIARMIKRGIRVVGVVVEGETARAARAIGADEIPGLFDRVDGTKGLAGVIERLIDILTDADSVGLRPRVLDIVGTPTGIDIWNNEIVVADVANGHVAAVRGDGSFGLLSGGSELHHLSLDKDKLLVCSKSQDVVLAARVVDGRTGPAFYIDACGDAPLCHPQGVYHGAGCTVIANTDAHEVWLTTDDLLADPAGGSLKSATWRSLDVRGRYPISVARTREFLWVTTLSPGAIEVFDVNGKRRRVRHVGPELDHPTSVAVWGNFLLVACADRELQLLNWSLERGVVVLRALAAEVHANVLKAPFAVAISPDGRVCITDRGWGNIWTTSMSSLLDAGVSDAA
jgi:hypothetical protein